MNHGRDNLSLNASIRMCVMWKRMRICRPDLSKDFDFRKIESKKLNCHIHPHSRLVVVVTFILCKMNWNESSENHDKEELMSPFSMNNNFFKSSSSFTRQFNKKSIISNKASSSDDQNTISGILFRRDLRRKFKSSTFWENVMMYWRRFFDCWKRVNWIAGKQWTPNNCSVLTSMRLGRWSMSYSHITKTIIRLLLSTWWCSKAVNMSSALIAGNFESPQHTSSPGASSAT